MIKQLIGKSWYPSLSLSYVNSYSFKQLISLVPSDPGVLAKLGELYDAENDRSQAYHYYYEVCQSSLNTLFHYIVS